MSFVLVALGLMVLLAVAGAAVLAAHHRGQRAKDARQAQERLERLRAEADERAAREREASERARAELVAAHERERERLRDELAQGERRLRQREAGLDRRGEMLEQREIEATKREAELDALDKQARAAHDEASAVLGDALRERERVAGLSKEQARAEIMAAVAGEARQTAARAARRIEEEAARSARERAQWLLAAAMQRQAAECVSEGTVSVVELPGDELKGRIIGREGRNIRAFEAATGVDVIIDDTPEVVVVSAFEPLRRHVAKVALERLVADGRIHPARIEEVVGQVQKDVEQELRRAGERAALELGIKGLHPELVRAVGKLKLVVVGGQSVLDHSVETAMLAGLLADELGVKRDPVVRAALLHDIGMGAPSSVAAEHAEAGAQLAQRFGERPEVVSAIRAHHEEAPPTVLAVLVAVANALSRERPGVRREQLEGQVRRLTQLEAAATSFAGVESAYAIQAGRELRVMVSFAQVSDDETLLLAREIARRVESEVTYAGDVRVTVVREARASELAR